MDLDLRKLRYFVAVADRLQFGRAADELHIAEYVLSRQSRALEQDLGASLFTRHSHGVGDRRRPTTPGRRRSAARLRARVQRRASEAAHGGRRLVVGFRTGTPVIPAARAFKRGNQFERELGHALIQLGGAAG
ncbi:hypothetical protein SALBM311S_01036 [Streptomyces alboniger]